MAYYSAHIHYKYRRIGTGSWTSSNTVSHQIKGNTESAVLEYLRKKHPHHDIEILEIDWK